MSTEVPKDESSELLKELKLIRSILFGLFVLGTIVLAYHVVSTSMPRPAPNWQELGAIRDELRNIHQEVRSLRPPAVPPIVIPVIPKDGKKDAKS